MESIKPDELIRAFLDGATDMHTGTKMNPGPLRIMNDKLICFQTVICERFGDKFIINPQFYSRKTEIAQDILLRLIPKDRQILTAGVPFTYWGSLKAYIIEESSFHVLSNSKGELPYR